MANLDEIHPTTLDESQVDEIPSLGNVEIPAEETIPLKNSSPDQQTIDASVPEYATSVGSPRSAGIFAKTNPSVVIDAIPDSAAALQTESQVETAEQAPNLAEIDDFQEVATNTPQSEAVSVGAADDFEAALAKMLNQESAFSTEPVEAPSAEPADDFPVDKPVSGDKDVGIAPKEIQSAKASTEPIDESPTKPSNFNPQVSPTMGVSAAWEAFYQDLVSTNKSQKIKLANENSPYAVFESVGDKHRISFFDPTGKEEIRNGAPSEQLAQHFAGHGIGDVFTTRLATGKNIEQNAAVTETNQADAKPNGEGEAEKKTAQMIVAPSATDTEPQYREAAEPRFAASTPANAFHGPSAALASALIGTVALPLNVLAALNDKVRDFRLAKRSASGEATFSTAQNGNVEGPSQSPVVDDSPSVNVPAIHERLSHKLKDYAAAIDRFHETPEMEEVSKALDNYSPENRSKALKDDPAIAKLVHQAIAANPGMVNTIHAQAKDVEAISEDLDETVFSKLQKEQASQLQDALSHAQEKTKTLPFHETFDSLKDKFSSAMSSIFDKLGAFISKLTQGNRAEASASAELS